MPILLLSLSVNLSLSSLFLSSLSPLSLQKGKTLKRRPPQSNYMMDDDALNMRNWGYYEPSFKGHLGLQLMSTIADCDPKHYLPVRDPSHGFFCSSNGGFHHRESVVPEAPVHMNYPRDGWINHRDKFTMLPSNPNNAFLPENPATHPLQILPPSHTLPEEMVERVVEQPPSKKEGAQSRKRQSVAPKILKAKKAKKPKENSQAVQRVKPPKKGMELMINGIDMDISGIPIPVCSCTGTPQQCYRWGYGGWQSACCTTNVSTYPLPMNTKRRGARIAGRKMSQGAFKKVLEKLASEGYNFANSIDLRTHWARHGTNKFVTIK